MEIEEEEGVTIIAFVNGKSGGQQGAKVKGKLVSLIGQDNVFDLSEGGPEKGLLTFAHKVACLRIIACGGDGTVCWVMSILDKLNWKMWPPIAVLPLGTGNDMARILLWGSGYEGENLGKYINRIKVANSIQLDRWKVKCVPLTEKEIERTKEKIRQNKHSKDPCDDDSEEVIDYNSVDQEAITTQIIEGSQDEVISVEKLDHENKDELAKDKVKSTTNSPTTNRSVLVGSSRLLPKSLVNEEEDKNVEKSRKRKISISTKRDHDVVDIAQKVPENGHGENREDIPKEREFVVNNYFSIGLDGRIALDFHNLRNKNPELFKSKLVNFGWYGAIGLKSAITHWKSLHKLIILTMDGEVKRLPKNILALVILNIPSYAGGTDLWGSKKGQSQRINDKKFEVVGLRGAFHIAQIQGKMAQGLRIGQASQCSIQCLGDIEAQIDGEPFKLFASDITVSFHNQAPVLLNSNRDKKRKMHSKLQGQSHESK